MLNRVEDILSGLTPEERANAIKILNEMSDCDGHSELLQALYEEDYEEIPVDIDTFIESNEYCGRTTDGGKLIYPYWRDRLRELFEDPNKYQEVAITGSIGTGKSTVACYGMAYLLYRVMCLKDPQKYFRLAAGSTIVFAFFNNTLDLSSSVGYGTVQNIIQNSPWFMERGTISGSKNLEYVPNKLIRFRVGSTASHALGTNIIAAMLDEVSFKQGANVQMEKSKIMETYNGVLERMGSRFMVNGKIAGKLFIVSSKKSEYDFLESYIRKQKGKPGVMVCDAKLWEVKPSQTYCGKKFNVAIGGANRPSRIVQDDEDPDAYVKQGYDVIEVPIEFRNRFELDIQAAIMNIAGISISNSTRFISYENLARCYKNNQNPFDSAILTIGMYDTLRIQDFFHPEQIPPEIYTRPIFIHIDTSLTGDKTGISAIAVMGYKNVNEYSIQSGDIETTKELYYHHIFTVGIQCPSSSEISFQKTRDFIYFLRYQCNWNIRAVSTDGFQSADTKQQLITMGFTDSKIVSLDRSPDGYIAYKAAINEQRITHLHIPELEFEIINLAKDNQTGKVDHDVDKSKDLSDSVAGAVYNASLHEQELNLGASDMYDVIFDTNVSEDEDDDRLSLLQKILPQVKAPSINDSVQEPINPNLQPSGTKNPFNPYENDDNGFFFL